MILICLLVASHDMVLIILISSLISSLFSYWLVLYHKPHIQTLKDPLILKLRGLSRCFFPNTIDVSAYWKMRNHLFFPSRAQQTRRVSDYCVLGLWWAQHSFVRTICRWLLERRSDYRFRWKGGMSSEKVLLGEEESHIGGTRLPPSGFEVRGNVHWKVISWWRDELTLNKRSTSFPVSCSP